MAITGTQIKYYFICHRKLWLFMNGIEMEHTSDEIADGELIQETSYQDRADRYRELNLSYTLPDGQELAGKLDFYDPKENCIHETKRSESMEVAHEWQVKFYLWLLHLNGTQGAKGMIEYPTSRQTHCVSLLPEDVPYLERTVEQIAKLPKEEICPPPIHSKICRRCAYFDFCYASELDSA